MFSGTPMRFSIVGVEEYTKKVGISFDYVGVNASSTQDDIVFCFPIKFRTHIVGIGVNGVPKNSWIFGVKSDGPLQNNL